MSLRIGVVENTQFFGRTFWELLEVMKEVGIENLQLSCRPGSTWSSGQWGRDPQYGSEELCIFPIEYADPTTLRPSLDLKEKIESYGIRVTSFYLNCEWVASLWLGDTQLDIEADRVMELCDTANKWNVPVIRIAEGPVEKHPYNYVKVIRDYSKRRCIEQIRKGLQRCAKYAQETGVHLALENHSVLVYHSPDDLVSLIKSVGSDYLGLNVDTGNYFYSGALPDELESYLKTAALYAYSAHIKDAKRQWDVSNPPPRIQRNMIFGVNQPHFWDCPIGDGDVPIKLFVDEVKKNSKFRQFGTLNIQQESGDPRIARIDMLRKSFTYLKSIV